MAAPAQPPRLARWILDRALAGPARSAIVGDIEEEFVCYVAPRLGLRAARRWYWRQTILSIAACLRGPDAPQPARVPEPRMSLFRRFDELRCDIAGALRQMRRAPAFTALAIVTLALGIGANSAIFALVDATLLRPLPVPGPDRLVILSERTAAGSRSRVSPPNMIDWLDRTRTFEGMAGFAPRVGAMVMAGTHPGERVAPVGHRRILPRLRRAPARRPHLHGGRQRPGCALHGRPWRDVLAGALRWRSHRRRPRRPPRRRAVHRDRRRPSRLPAHRADQSLGDPADCPRPGGARRALPAGDRPAARRRVDRRRARRPRGRVRGNGHASSRPRTPGAVSRSSPCTTP